MKSLAEIEQELFNNSPVPDYFKVTQGHRGLTLKLDLGLDPAEADRRVTEVKSLGFHGNQVELIEVDGPRGLPWEQYTETFVYLLIEKNVHHIAIPEVKVQMVSGKIHEYLMEKLESTMPSVQVFGDHDIPLHKLIDVTPLTSRIVSMFSIVLENEHAQLAETLSSFQQKHFVPRSLRRQICNLEKVARKNTRADRKHKRFARQQSNKQDEAGQQQQQQQQQLLNASPSRRSVMKKLKDTLNKVDIQSNFGSSSETEDSMADLTDNPPSPQVPTFDEADDIRTHKGRETGPDDITAIVGRSKYEEKEKETPHTYKCYVCKARYVMVTKETNKVKIQYPRLCLPCAKLNFEMRYKQVDLTSYYAVVTGGRIKIGYEIVLKLLRDGCHVITTTRFPHDAVHRYAAELDAQTWSKRLKVYPLELKDYQGIYKFCEHLKRTVPHLDIVINNAAQTLHRPYSFYKHLLPREQLPLQALTDTEQHLLTPGVNLTYRDNAESLVGVLCGGLGQHGLVDKTNMPFVSPSYCSSPPVTDLPITTASSTTKRKLPFSSFTSPPQNKVAKLEPKVMENANKVSSETEANVSDKADVKVTKQTKVTIDDLGDDSTNDLHPIKDTPVDQYKDAPDDLQQIVKVSHQEDFPSGCVDEFGQQLDLRQTNSWRSVLENVPVAELVEVMMVNTIAPYIINKELKPLLTSSPHDRRFIVNVSAMEGQFARSSKTKYHPHTNMAKAALNMMTRTGALGYREAGIFMTAVDTGWVTDERPYGQATREADVKGFVLPLDCVDGAARVLHPIYSGVQNNDQEPHYAVFLKNYAPYPW